MNAGQKALDQAVRLLLRHEFNDMHDQLRGVHYFRRAASILLEGLEPHHETIEHVVTMHLDEYFRKPKLFRNSSLLDEARRVAALGVPRSLSERILSAYVRRGYIDDAKEVAMQLLSRDLTREEVLGLCKAYTDDGASDSDEQTRRVRALARQYLSSEDLAQVERDISKKKRDFALDL